ncbi:MAG: DUF3782 domain-containing protein [Candidatus Bathyarchaeia archaeon]
MWHSGTKSWLSLEPIWLRALNLLRRYIDDLGARWGMMSEQGFRDGFKDSRVFIERKFGFKIEKWVRWDNEGYVSGSFAI